LPGGGCPAGCQPCRRETMNRSEGTGRTGSGERYGSAEAFESIEKFLTALSGAGAGATQGAHDTAIETAARVSGAPVSLWRFGEEGLELVACAGLPGEKARGALLAAMKDKASSALALRLPQQGPQLKIAAPDAAGRLEALQVRAGSSDWGALVYEAAGLSERCVISLKAVSSAVGLAAERDSLREQVLALRARTAAGERDGAPEGRYVTVGQLAVYTYREIDEILKSVVADLGKRSLGTEAKAAGSLSELKRARDIVGDQLELVKLEMPVLKMRDLNVIVQGAVSALEEEIHSKQLRLMKRLASGMPELLLDEDKIEVAVRKVLAAAIARSPAEGWLRVETAQQDQDVLLQVTWEDRGSPGGATEHMFAPFGALEGGGMGLMVASQIIREHGGGVRVQRYESGSTALILDFPIGENQERRRKSRRSGVDRRRPPEI
jgi:signal transduction histidine kinase